METDHIITLKDEERTQLHDIAAKAPELLRHRAALILAYAEGKPTLQASRASGVSTGRARFWKRQFIAKRMAIFDIPSIPVINDEGEQEDVHIVTDKTLTDSMVAEADETAPKGVEEVPYPQPRQQIGITLEDTLSEAGRKVWSFYFAEMLGHEAGTLLGEDIEELHDMRVATRRMRSAFDVFGPAYDAKLLRRHLKGLRIAGQVLGRVRDMDVILGNAVSYQKKLKENLALGLEPLLNGWQQTISHQRLRLTKHLQSDEYHHFKINFNLFLQSAEQDNYHIVSSDGKSPYLRDMVPVLVYSRYAAVRAYESLLPTASIIQLHALRIDCKKFRYTLEYFKEILGDDISKSIDELKRMQDHLGELHDADVACGLVRAFLKKLDENQQQVPIVERINPEPIVIYLAYLHAERYRLTRSFPELWKKFNRPEFRQRIAQAVSLL
ncbi:MAG: hypothetical protein C3F13_10695 [Anaerolineales bacterium]|nr:CHAD domain-containing protein [Anaerolineae bacterium]PWB53076.1 MAG: hypothetical protein C3F13_10695 [Anaerolineales bacterium]